MLERDAFTVRAASLLVRKVGYKQRVWHGECTTQNAFRSRMLGEVVVTPLVSQIGHPLEFVCLTNLSHEQRLRRHFYFLEVMLLVRKSVY